MSGSSSTTSRTALVQLPLTGGAFSTALPRRLEGLVSCGDYARSITRCNTAYTTGSMRLPIAACLLAILIGFGLIYFSMKIASGTYMTLLGVAAIAAGFVCVYVRAKQLRRLRLASLLAAIKLESARYYILSPANTPPLTWSLVSTYTQSYNAVRVLCLQIEVKAPIMSQNGQAMETVVMMEVSEEGDDNDVEMSMNEQPEGFPYSPSSQHVQLAMMQVVVTPPHVEVSAPSVISAQAVAPSPILVQVEGEQQA